MHKMSEVPSEKDLDLGTEEKMETKPAEEEIPEQNMEKYIVKMEEESDESKSVVNNKKELPQAQDSIIKLELEKQSEEKSNNFGIDFLTAKVEKKSDPDAAASSVQPKTNVPKTESMVVNHTLKVDIKSAQISSTNKMEPPKTFPVQKNSSKKIFRSFEAEPEPNKLSSTKSFNSGFEPGSGSAFTKYTKGLIPKAFCPEGAAGINNNYNGMIPMANSGLMGGLNAAVTRPTTLFSPSTALLFPPFHTSAMLMHNQHQQHLMQQQPPVGAQQSQNSAEVKPGKKKYKKKKQQQQNNEQSQMMNMTPFPALRKLLDFAPSPPVLPPVTSSSSLPSTAHSRASLPPPLVHNPPSSAAGPTQPQPSQTIGGPSNTCAKCGIVFRMTSDLVYHMRTHHTRPESESSYEKRREFDRLKCDVCGENFKERHHLTRHMTAHQERKRPLTGTQSASDFSLQLFGDIHQQQQQQHLLLQQQQQQLGLGLGAEEPPSSKKKKTKAVTEAPAAAPFGESKFFRAF